MFDNTQHQWDNLLRVVGHPDLIGDSRFVDPRTRANYGDFLDKLISDWTSTKSAYEAFNILASNRVSTGVTLTSSQTMNDPNVTYRKKVVEIEHPIRGKSKTLSYAPNLEKSPIEIKSAPLLGQDMKKCSSTLWTSPKRIY